MPAGTLLERVGQPLTQRAHMMRMVPKVEAKEFATVLDEISGMLVTAIFDGTTRVGEALNVILRYCTADFHVVQRLVAFVTLQKLENITHALQRDAQESRGRLQRAEPAAGYLSLPERAASDRRLKQ